MPPKVNADVNSVSRASCKTQSGWLAQTIEAIRVSGCMVVEDVLSSSQVDETRDHLYQVQEKIVADIGRKRLQMANEIGVLRLMMKFDPYFLKLLEIPEMLAVVDATVSPTAILHLQNGFILPSAPSGDTPRVFQNLFHRDFPRYLNGCVASVNAFLALDDYTTHNGATRIVPGTHQQKQIPEVADMERQAVSVECARGSMIIFDSTLWHAAGHNTSPNDRLGINHQFTWSFLKQQIDYVRALGTAEVERQPTRTQQLLGFFTRVVTSLDEYYQPEDKRLYRKNQG